MLLQWCCAVCFVCISYSSYQPAGCTYYALYVLAVRRTIWSLNTLPQYSVCMLCYLQSVSVRDQQKHKQSPRVCFVHILPWLSECGGRKRRPESYKPGLPQRM